MQGLWRPTRRCRGAAAGRGYQCQNPPPREKLWTALAPRRDRRRGRSPGASCRAPSAAVTAADAASARHPPQGLFTIFRGGNPLGSGLQGLRGGCRELQGLAESYGVRERSVGPEGSPCHPPKNKSPASAPPSARHSRQDRTRASRGPGTRRSCGATLTAPATHTGRGHLHLPQGSDGGETNSWTRALPKQSDEADRLCARLQTAFPGRTSAISGGLGLGSSMVTRPRTAEARGRRSR